MKSSNKFIFVVLSTITILPIGCHPAYAEDCKYEKNVQLAENGSILSADTTYECVKSQPIIVLDPVVSDVVVQSTPTVTYGKPLSAEIVANPIQPKRKCYANWNTGGTDCYVGGRPRVVSTSDYRNMMLGNNNSKGLDFFAKLIYNVN